MDIEGRNIWQVAAGDNERWYPDVFLRWDVIAMGPGRHGPWPDHNAEIVMIDGYSARKLTDIKKFCETIQAGDLVVLRVGTQWVYGVGEVVGEGAAWLDDFGDIDGWDLQYVRRVKWLWKYNHEPKNFPAHTLKRGDTVLVMSSDDVREWLTTLVIDEREKTRKLEELPDSCVDEKPGDEADMERVAGFLFDQGIAASSIDNLVDQMDELVRIARWYQRTRQSPSESETVTYLVAPLLRTLGWTPQKMAIEWNRVDVALFNSTPRQDEKLRAVVEVKKMNSSCLTARSQAEDYALRDGRASCHLLIVTDGLRYCVVCRRHIDHP
ncbi:MAG: hypothetical protein DWQ31_08735 [Planctomycetota bacterium]|nr:MAG: hypothetical protein DWQ31_08735 [Planctomycetota bacterium]REJ86925.1 MAG: hypothetical protein DWQ35_22435 [Planctomycetota bacterium]REK24948.1 MAG: hypothetical protein DWQ42_12735 [Planctomycetota bacterium]REK48537.1 MAG: hypothetical protein DWQ46_02265 [Planctomycetota bacterium]